MANFSQINAVSGGQVKLADDLWLVRSGALVPAIEAWAVKSGQLVKVWERYGGPTTMTWQSPAADSTVLYGNPLTWTVKVNQGSHFVKPRGTVRFTFADGTTQDKAVAADGTASVVKYMHDHPGTYPVTARLLSSDNGFTAFDVTRQVFVKGGETTLEWVSPAVGGQEFYGPCNITWRLRAKATAGGTPSGQIRFSGPSGYNFVDLDENGYAETVYWHEAGQKQVSAQLWASDDGWTSQPIDRTITLKIATRYQQQAEYTYKSHRNYAGANAGPQTGPTMISGDNTDGKSWRAFQMVNLPAKPQADASCVGAYVWYTSGLTTAGIRIGYHTLGGFPGTGSFAQAGVHQNLVTGPGAQGTHTQDIGLHVAAAINNQTLRGLVWGGPAGYTPPASVTANAKLVVMWEWWRWIDT